MLIDSGHDIRFRVVLSHEFKFGFDIRDQETTERISSPIQANLDEMRPASRRSLNWFAISEEPIRAGLADQLLGRPSTGPSSYPAFLTRSQAELCVDALGCDFPTEVQWEAAIRGGSEEVFAFGNDLPGESELETWMLFDLDDPRRALNGFGLAGLFFGEWCKEAFAISHDPDAAVLEGSYTIKGGGAYFWPWQDDEWVWCMSAMRMPSVDLVDGTAALRLVLQTDS